MGPSGCTPARRTKVVAPGTRRPSLCTSSSFVVPLGAWTRCLGASMGKRVRRSTPGFRSISACLDIRIDEGEDVRLDVFLEKLRL